MVHEAEADLFEVVDALCASCGFTCGLHSWEQQRDQNGDDSNHNE
jgi:ribosomal protein L37E